MALEEVGEIQHGPPLEPPLYEQKGNQQSTNPPVAVEERVNGLELSVGQGNLHENWQSTVGMKKPFQSRECLRYLVRCRRDKNGIL